MELAKAIEILAALKAAQAVGDYAAGSLFFTEDAVAELPMILGTKTGRAELIALWTSQDAKGLIERGEAPEVKEPLSEDGPNCFKRTIAVNWTMMNATLTQRFTFNDAGLITKMSTCAL
ncbi:hypothetical protein CYMTET_27038 [Cymbomonas tetramitiformis]|uniref:Uncharacterized protein n=1 Tax=Cymbomonas tetramitiformis TaxID=36881 RepID=A0AAE0FR63_9CHLO|nr:hypothetical protein CYMTET_27038 [Cymbomonas tetramitiformis]